MSLLLTPRRSNPADTQSQTNMSLFDAQDALELLRLSTQRETQRNLGYQVKDRSNTNQAFLSFRLPAAPEGVRRDDLDAAEAKIAQLLMFSRVPGASGHRGVFVDLTEGVLLVGTTVFYNERHAALGVEDESLVHKIEMIQATLALASFDQAPHSHASNEPIVIRIEGLTEQQLERTQIAIGDNRYSLGDIAADVEPIKDDAGPLHILVAGNLSR